MMDKTSLNLISILIGGAGLFVAITKFNVPELNMTFLDTNPFAIKRDEIDSVMTWIFTSLAGVGVLVRAVVLISDCREERSHKTCYYVSFFLITFTLTAFLVMLLTVVGNKLARTRWLPKIVENQGELYKSSKFIIEHDGWREDQLPVKDNFQNPEENRRENHQAADQYLTQMEKLLDIIPAREAHPQRLARIKTYFER